MATVIERLVIQGSNPARPATAGAETKRPKKPQRIVFSAKSCTSTNTKSGIFDFQPHRQERTLSGNVLTISGQGSGTFGTRVGAGSEGGQSEMQSDLGLHVGGVTPIVKKMEYLALVRQAREGMSSVDTNLHHLPPPDPPKELFVVEGRKVSNLHSMSQSTSSLEPTRAGVNNNKKSRHFFDGLPPPPPPRTAPNYSVSEFSFANEKPEGHVDQYRMFQSRESRGGPRSVRSIRSDTTTSVRSIQFPALTRGSSEPGPSYEYERRMASQTKTKIAFAQEVMSECDTDAEMALDEEVDLVLSRVKEARANKQKQQTGNGVRGVEDELNACLNIEGHTEVVPREGFRWTPSKQMLMRNNKSVKSEGALLFRRHKLMEKKTQKSTEKAAKYTFSSVKSYLNFNKIMRPDSESQPTTQRSSPRLLGPMLNGNLRKSGIGVKRGKCDNSSVIFELDECFKVKTPRFDIKPTLIRSNTLLRSSSKKIPPMAVTENSAVNNGNGVAESEAIEEASHSPSPVSQEDTVTKKIPRVPIVAVPSADSEHWNENILS